MDDLEWMTDAVNLRYTLDFLPKVGDKVICTGGFKSKGDWDRNTFEYPIEDPDYGGYGYSEDKIFTVGQVLVFTPRQLNMGDREDKVRAVIYPSELVMKTHVFHNAVVPYHDE